MPPDFLNSREDAFVLWALLAVGYLIFKDARGIGGAFLNVVRAALHPKLVILFGSAFLYLLLLVYAAEVAGLWHTTSLNATVYWFVGTAVVLISDAVTRASPRDLDLTRRTLKRLIGVTILIEFVVTLYVFPLAVEVIGVGIAVTFTMLQVVVGHDASADPRARRLIEGVLTTVGVVYLAYFAVRGVGDLLDGAISREPAEEFLVGPVLTIALIPLLYVAARWSRRDKENYRRGILVRQGRLEETRIEDPLMESDRAA
jgi:hypothetical protein